MFVAGFRHETTEVEAALIVELDFDVYRQSKHVNNPQTRLRQKSSHMIYNQGQ